MTVEEAITRLEFMATNLTGGLANACQPDIFSQLLSDSIDAIDMAQEALREQAEREKGCVWCKEDNKVFHDGKHYHLFCSYCGKRLEAKP